MLALCGCKFTTLVTGDVSVEFEHGLLLDHHPGNPSIGDGEQEEQSYNGTGTEAQKLDAQGEGKEDASREDVDGPLKTHGNKIGLAPMYLRCFINGFSHSCCQGYGSI